MINKKFIAWCFLSVLIVVAGNIYLLTTPTPKCFSLIGLLWLIFIISPLVLGIRQYRILKALTSKSVFTLKTLPQKEDSIYLGRAFRWENEHIKRVDLLIRQPKIDKLWEQGGDEGGVSILHGVGATSEKDYFIPARTFGHHMAVVGTTGVGKTRLAELMLMQLLDRNEPVIIIDPKGEPELLNSVYSKLLENGQQDRLSFFSPSYPQISETYNPLQNYDEVTDIADRISAVLSGAPEAQPYKDFCADVVLHTVKAMIAVGESVTLENLMRFALNEQLTQKLLERVVTKYYKTHGKNTKKIEDSGAAKAYMEALEKTGIKDEACEGLAKLCNESRFNFQRMSSSLGPLFSRLTEGAKKRFFSPEDPGISWLEAVKERKVVYFYMGSLVSPDTVNAMCRMAIQDFASYIGKRYFRSGERYPIWLFVDEYQDVDYDRFVNLLSKGRGAGLRLILAMQSIADLKVKTPLGAAHARQILANTGTKIFLRTGDAETAKEFTDKAGKTKIADVTEMISVSPEVDDPQEMFDTTYRKTKKYEEVQRVQEDWITGLPVGQAFISTEGNRLYKARFPMLERAKHDYLKDRGIDISQDSSVAGITSKSVPELPEGDKIATGAR